VVASFHRPHTAKEAKRYHVRDAREFLTKIGFKPYFARIEFDAADRIFVGHIAGINDIVGFHGESVAELETAFHEAVDAYLESSAKIGKPPENPCSGRVMFRVDPAIHARAALAAQLRGLSLNQCAEEALARQAGTELERT
jgi:predicted HicB family RNase H-like nuclease